MTSRLITTWTDYDNAVQEVLELSASTLQIFDEDLSPLKLERPQRIAALRALLAAQRLPQATGDRRTEDRISSGSTARS
jgi:hypothetical protein